MGGSVFDKDWGVGLAAGEVAAQAFTNLGVDDWQRLADLGTRHQSGRLSQDAWRCATLAVVAPALERAEHQVAQMIQRGWRGE